LCFSYFFEKSCYKPLKTNAHNIEAFLATSDCPKIAILPSFVEDGMKKARALVGDTPKKRYR
jgi:hypothetical protein